MFFRQHDDIITEQANLVGARDDDCAARGADPVTKREACPATETADIKRSVITPPSCGRRSAGFAISGLLGVSLAQAGAAYA